MTLSLYIARRFLFTFLRVFGVFFGVLYLIDILEQLRRFKEAGGLGLAARMAALNVPESLYTILPLVMILSAIALFLGLARSSELVVVRAAGRSGLRFLLTPVWVAMVIGLVAVAVLNPLVAATSKEYAAARAALVQEGASVLSISDEGLWLRQGAVDGQTVIHADQAGPDGTQLFGVTFLTFDASGQPVARIAAGSARLEAGAWVVTDARRWDLTAANPDATVEQSDSLRLPSELTAERIRDSFGEPSSIAVWDLPAYIAGLERAGFSATGYKVWFQNQLALPLFLSAMVLVAAGFTMRHMRAGKVGMMVLLAILGGFALFFLRNFAQVLGDNGQIPVAMAAWTPPLAAVLLAMGLLLHLEDG